MQNKSERGTEIKMKRRKISEKTVYTILWSTVAASAALLVGLCIFAAAKKADRKADLTRPSAASGKVSSTSATPDPLPPTTDADTSVDAPAVVFIAPISGVPVKAHTVDTLCYSKTMDDYRAHTGVDIEAELGSGVYAALDGVVSAICDDPLMGKVIEITHESGHKTLYKNLALELPEGIAVGVSVEKGQLIGAVGQSAICELADEPHLHFEIVGESGQIDPCEIIDFDDQ